MSAQTHDFTTPMMRQYMDIKKQYQDCLLFYRMGDFYELFLEDAYIGAQVLGITLTGRPKGQDGRIPMAGVPFHAVDSYLTKLVQAGYKVAICEQVSLPNKKGIIDREVIRIVTPGTVLDEKALAQKDNNYIISLLISGNELALGIADISTGYFATTVKRFEDLETVLKDELSRLDASECILPEELYNDPLLLKMLKSHRGLTINCFQQWGSHAENASDLLKKQFGVSNLGGFGIETEPLCQQVSAALLGYLHITQKNTVAHIRKVLLLTSDEFVSLDRSTMINLELFSTIREHDTKGSLLNVLDQTITPMGGRLLKQWLAKPLKHPEKVNERHEAVEFFVGERDLRNTCREALKSVNDVERVLSRLTVNLGNARDLVNLKSSLQTILELKSLIVEIDSPLIKQTEAQISERLQEVIDVVETTIVDAPPFSIREGGMIRSEVRSDLDELRSIVHNNKDWILELERQEREKTGISSLKVRFNKVFGFYIEVSKSNLDSVPSYYMRKQTLVNGERFITPALKEKEELILTAEEKINELEFELFNQVLTKVLGYTDLMQEAASAVASLDCLLNFAHIAETSSYVRPKLLYSGELKINDGRHPVVEKLLGERQFVPNSVDLDNTNQQLVLLTGPNMAGKSVYIRQVALVVLMNQIGSFVPAYSAHLSLVDRIFVRSGASDVITSGLSTFMVEMVETAHILNNATKNSLIVMDEIGRGTSTYDGISIAWAVAEFLVTKFKTPPKTLFATHYHELQELETQFPHSIKNYHMEVEQNEGEPVFLHTIASGGASHSFGVAVAKLAGVPDTVVEKAKHILESLEKRNVDGVVSELKEPVVPSVHSLPTLLPQLDLFPIEEQLIYKELEVLDISQMTPLEALNKLAQLKEKLKFIQKETKSVSKVN